ncbi:hypothetical protein CANCADRAFT_23992 [Tortispora caseinolytica NRRL Y-17796]|uniref:Large ribosomal subunit protein uL2m n=1 Tax=Tortispora caseinolytica NRRL Y-17796 TaxID=767744 RepID=A0A1E4TDN7_9ASCO|nr:hypothetical protein CANCADRAFT_23992 [Tortispora caseinolytica NRRL Y-17796]
MFLHRSDVPYMKKIIPNSPGALWYRKPVYPYLHKGGPFLPLTKALRKKGGRNNQGRVTVRGRGGGHKRRLRIIDFLRAEPGAHTVVRIEHDPNRTAHIALISNDKTERLSYIIAPQGIRAGDKVESFRMGIPQELVDYMGGQVDPALLSARTVLPGNCLPMHMIPPGTIIHNVGLTSRGPAKLCRSAGTYARLVSKDASAKQAAVRLQSGEVRYVSLNACATVGVVSNPDHQNAVFGKAGRRRWLGRRPKVRGMAMNACDHPHGGGRGKSKGNVPSQSATGVLAKGYKTRRGKNFNKYKMRDRPRGKNNRVTA